MSRLRPAAEIGAVAALGAAQTLAFVHGWLWPLQVIAVAVLARFVAGASTARAALLGFIFGCAWLGAGTWWMFVSMHRYGGLAAPLAALAVAALSAFLSLYLAAAMALAARLGGGSLGRDAVAARAGNGSAGRGAIVFAAAWLLAELARGVLFTGFPWVASGYAFVDSPLKGFAPWLGVYGIGALAAGLAAFVGTTDFRQRRGTSRAAGVLAAALAAGVLLDTVRFTEKTKTLTVSLLQGNVPQHEKFAPRSIPQTLALTAEQLGAARGQLVVGPETVIPVLPRRLDPAYWRTIGERFAVPGRAALLGAPMGDESGGYTNSALGVSVATHDLPAGAYRYDKHHLVPFGEFVPTGFRWFTQAMNIPLGDFDRGPLAAPSFEFEGERIAPNICYEDLFGEELAARFVDTAQAPTILANMSNIGWFGRTIAIEQHLRISRMRALELERPMLRATNTGATAVVDHRGVVTHALAPFSRGVLEGSVEGRTGLTPFARWAGRFGLWPLWLLGVVLLVALRRRRRPSP